MKIGINLHTEFKFVHAIFIQQDKVFCVTFLLVLSLSSKSYSRNLYFSSSIGNDSYSSTQAQIFCQPDLAKSIDKLNSSMSLDQSGDSILFKGVMSFTGQITLSVSGSAGAM